MRFYLAKFLLCFLLGPDAYSQVLAIKPKMRASRKPTGHARIARKRLFEITGIDRIRCHDGRMIWL